MVDNPKIKQWNSQCNFKWNIVSVEHTFPNIILECGAPVSALLQIYQQTHWFASLSKWNVQLNVKSSLQINISFPFQYLHIVAVRCEVYFIRTVRRESHFIWMWANCERQTANWKWKFKFFHWDKFPQLNRIYYFNIFTVRELIFSCFCFIFVSANEPCAWAHPFYRLFFASLSLSLSPYWFDESFTI